MHQYRVCHQVFKLALNTYILFYSDDRKIFGNRAVFQILIKEIQHLQKNGIDVTVEGVKQTVFFDIGLILGDKVFTLS